MEKAGRRGNVLLWQCWLVCFERWFLCAVIVFWGLLHSFSVLCFLFFPSFLLTFLSHPSLQQTIDHSFYNKQANISKQTSLHRLHKNHDHRFKRNVVLRLTPSSQHYSNKGNVPIQLSPKIEHSNVRNRHLSLHLGELRVSLPPLLYVLDRFHELLVHLRLRNRR